MLQDGTYAEGVGRELHAAAAQLAHLVAWSAYDIQEHEQAQRYFAKATELATSAGDRAFCGEILAARSHHAIHLGHPVEALALARAAQQNASKAAVPALLAESHELEANGHALLGDSKASLASLHKAELAFQRSNSLNRPDWLHYFDDGYLAARFAHCFRDLKQWSHARDFGLQAVKMSEDLARTRVFNTAVLATAYVETDLDEACALGLHAAHLARTFQSARILHYIRDIRRRLHDRHGDHPQVQQFTEQLPESGAH
jgi:tetratricopeptide (TPR) repeat protein